MTNRDHERGQWMALNRVLALLNTYDSKEVPKKRLYQDVMALRPESVDPYAALSQHLHGDGDWPGPGEKPHQYSPDPMLMGDCRVCGHTASAHEAPTCATPGCTNRPVIRLDDRHLCRGCYATHDFGDDA